MKYRILIFIAILLSACTGENFKNISTSDAYTKYRQELEDMDFFAFPEIREKPVRWYDSIPEEKLLKIVKPGSFKMIGSPGEIFIFQIGVWAVNNDIDDLQIEFSDLKGR
jgi:hypothetical protein